ncbi:MAG: DNA methyltransferase [Parvularculaceae bacterium]
MGSELIEEIDPAALRPSPRNARSHSKKQIRQIVESITAFGFVNPVLIDEDGRVIAGHGRVEAAKLLGLPHVPCRRITHMTAEEKRAYALADNKLALNAGWDEEILALELQGLLETDVDFDISVIGFDPGEIDLIIEAPKPSEKHDPDDEKLPGIGGPPVTRVGDLWLLGEHRLFCGNSLEARSYQRLLGGERAEMVFSDPPYNVPIDGHVSGLGRIKHRDFAMASGEMTKTQFVEFLKTVFGHCASRSADGSIHFHCMDWRHLGEMLAAGESVYSELKNVCVWVKDNGGMGSFYRSRHELVFVFKNGAAPHVNNFGLGETGRYRTNVWNYRGVTSGGSKRLEELALHPTVKPVAMIADAIRDCSRRGGIILDPFGGSGSTLIAAERTKRRARLIEIDPLYVDRTIRRWQRVAHDDAILDETGESFDARARRLAGGKAESTQSKDPQSAATTATDEPGLRGGEQG